MCCKSDVIVEGLPWARKLVDDTIIWADNEEDLVFQTRTVLVRCKTNNITISRKKWIKKGSPQGSVLGCLLYCITTQLLTEDLRRNRGNDPPPDATRYFPQEGGDESDVRFWEQGCAGEGVGPVPFLYVDDTTLFDAVPLNSAVRHISSSPLRESFEDLELARDFEELSGRADEIGMVVNQKKTQLLVVSPPNGYDTSARIMVGNQAIRSVDTLKLVGFTFGHTPDATAHVKQIAEKHKRKKWMLYHLRDSGFKGKQLYKLYCCYVRSIIEYYSVVYNALLTKSQENQLERLQRHAVRLCYGHDSPIGEIMDRECIESLAARRERRCDAFVKKSASNTRFRESWFPLRPPVPWDIRERRGIKEIAATTRRRFM